jgi:hypothetical protein
MYNLLSLEIKILTLEEAKRLLALNVYDGQKDMDLNKLEEYEEKMLTGVFLIGDIVIVQLWDGTWVVINGQHQLTAFIRANKKKKMEITIMFRKYKCPTMADTGLLYRQFDEHSRALPDYAKAFSAGMGIEWLTKNPRIRKTILSGAVALNRARKWPLEKRLKLLNTYLEEGHFIYELLKHKGSKHLNRLAVAAEIIATYQTNPEIAAIFWPETRDGSAGSVDITTFALRDWLMVHSFTQGLITRRSGKIIVSVEECRYVIRLAWNAYLEGKKFTPPRLEALRSSDEPLLLPELLTKRVTKLKK